MGLFGFLSGGAKELIGAIGQVVDSVTTTQEEKDKAKIELEKLALQYTAMTEASYQAELSTQKEIIVAELQQGDSYTKRMRPSLGYFGMAVIFFNYCIVPLWKYLSGEAPQPFDLPAEFWLAWGGMMATYSIGRTMEKRNGGTSSKVVSMVTGASLKK
jgi:hypothetical protein